MKTQNPALVPYISVIRSLNCNWAFHYEDFTQQAIKHQYDSAP